MAVREPFGQDGIGYFGPDGTQDPPPPPAAPDALGGLVTGAAFEPFDLLRPALDQGWDQPAPAVTTPPAAPEPAQLRQALDKAMMTGPPTNPLRIAARPPRQMVRPAPTVLAAPRAIAPAAALPASTRPPGDRPGRVSRADSRRASLAGRPALRRRHPVASALIRLAVPIIFVVVVLLLHSFGGTLAGLFQ